MTTTTFDIYSHPDIIDSRDIIARLEELRSDAIVVLETMHEDDEDYDGGQALDDMIDAGVLDIDPDLFFDTDELLMLTEVNQEGENNCPDWQYGETLIKDSYFEEYAEDFASDIGVIDNRQGNMQWPLNRIDWKAAAEDLQEDYTSMEIDGITYWGR